MARVTVQDAVNKIGNRFDLILIASRRARQLAIEGKEPMVDAQNDKPTVTALREIERGLVDASTLEHDEMHDQEQQDNAEFASVANILSDQ